MPNQPIPFNAPQQGPAPPNPRQIVQIAAGVDQMGSGTLWCLCDDGSVWMANLRRQDWTRMPEAPQS